MSKFSYSVAIRTLGTAGEKYEKLLKSIQKQTIQPEKIVVVLPEGYNIPEYQIGTEEFVFCEKGMIIQRLEAMKYIESDYVLFTDDDIEYEEAYIDKLSKALQTGAYAGVAGPLTDFFPPDTLKYKLASMLGGACVMIHGRKNHYVRILRTGGWSYNHNIKVDKPHIYETESLAWTNFLIRKDIMQQIAFDDEIWSERNGYSAFEDRIMFYKLVVNGYRVGVVSDARYEHNDGKTSTRNLRMEPVYAGAFNHYVFWHRFLYSLSRNPFEKGWMRLCIEYYILIGRIYSKCLYRIGRETREQAQTTMQGFRDAKAFVKSKEYLNLPSVYVKGRKK